jgi:hypothetical protein
MKLVDVRTYQVVEVLDKNIPPYAILSHTWEANQEVSYQEMIAGSGKEKTRYAKIQLCCIQALTDGLDWAWVDTCCTIQSHHR